MKNYYKVIQYGNEEDYSTKETIIDEPTFRQYQKLISEGKEKIVLKEAIISVSSIKEIVLANDVVSDYQRRGIKIDGLFEPMSQPQITRRSGTQKVGDYLRETHDAFYERMGWKS